MTNREMEFKLNATYDHIKHYLNDTDNEDSIKLLHNMCKRCENFGGIEKHDYSECRHEPCFILFLGFENMCWDWAE